jgi:hypothetical protein
MAGRKPDSVGKGRMTVSEAARALGISAHAIRARLERGTLQGERVQRTTSSGSTEPRWEVSEVAVRRELERRKEVARREDVTQEVAIQGEEMRELTDRVIDAILGNRESLSSVSDAINRQRQEVTGAVERQREEFVESVRRVASALEAQDEHYQPAIERIISQQQEVSEFMKEQAETGVEYQERVRDHEKAIRRLIGMALVALAVFATLVLAVLIVEIIVLH